MSGYVACACRDCFEIAVADDDGPALCWACEETGCNVAGGEGCQCEPDPLDAWYDTSAELD